MHRRAALACTSPHDTRAFLDVVCRRANYVARPRHQPASTYSKDNPLRVSKEEYDNAKKTTYKVMQRAAHTPPYWKETPTLRGKEKRLAALIDAGAAPRKSLNQETFESGEETDSSPFGEADVATSAVFPPGTFVETRRNGVVSYGIVLEEYIIASKRRKMATLMSTGEIWYPGRQDVLYTLPNFVSAEQVIRCGTETLNVTKSEKNARVEVLRRLQELERTSEVMYNIVAQKCRTVYDQVKSSDPDAWATTTVFKIAKLVTDKSDDMTLFALHKYLLDHPLHFIVHHSYEFTRMLHVRPQSHVDDITTVKEWTRRRDSPIAPFVIKAKEIMPVLEQIQLSSSAEPPSYQRSNHEWSDTDQTILRFLQRSLRQTRTNQADPYDLGISHILKQLFVGRPFKSSNDRDNYTAIVNLGVLAPWQDLPSLDPVLDLDTEPQATSTRIKKQEAIAAKGIASMAKSGTNTPLGPTDFHRTDPLESVRHDFGELPVFVIDDATAEELDDGISIERIPSEPDTFWLHTHIADPASLIPPTHVLAKEAATRVTSIYFTHRSWSLFPETVMTHPTHGVSLSRGRNNNGAPLRVISFSSKVDSQGNLKEYKVRAGLIRNVQVITYDEADTALGKLPPSFSYPFGRVLQPGPTRRLSETHMKDIQDLRRVADSIIAKRYRDGIVHPSMNFGELTPVIRAPPEISGPVSEPMTFRGSPTFEYSVQLGGTQTYGSHGIVAEAMQLASRVASLFCTEHGIPIMRRVSDPKSMRFCGDLKEVLDMRQPNCYVHGHTILSHIEAVATNGYSMEPKANYHMGLLDGEGYSRATSPLRRYIDLVVHWQIHHGLLGSAAPKASPPFSAEEVWDIIKFAGAVENTCAVAQRAHRRFWQAMFIKRWAQENPDSSLLNNIKGYTLARVLPDNRTRALQTSVECPQLGLTAMLEDIPTMYDTPPGTEVNVRIKEVVLGTRPKIVVQPSDPKVKYPF
ncbi:hypothetical protein DXG01_007144 [Tephrocybe rancida]|nr:hypothetical protein DXG01_007144 [Tephrocybe rancida]